MSGYERQEASGGPMVLALAGVSPVFCAALPAAVFGVPTILWNWRDLRAMRQRAARDASKETP